MINSDKLAKLKELLDSGAITQEEFEQQKKLLFTESSKQNKSEKIKITIGIFVVVIICISIIGSFVPSNEKPINVQSSNAIIQQSQIPNEFNSECPVTASGSIYDNIIGVPELSINIANNTDKEISAIKIYFLPKDVYGEAVDSIFTTKLLYTDDSIAANMSATKSWQLLDQEIKSGDVYIYSVYFSDGTQWGNKEAALSDIQKYGYNFEVKY